MFYFILAIAIFLIFLIWICISLCMILKMRNNVEECEYILKKACERQYDFTSRLGLDEKALSPFRKEMARKQELDDIIKCSYMLSKHMDTISLCDDDMRENESLKAQIDKYINLYNNAVDTFNSVVFSPLNIIAARICGVRRMERLV